MTKRVSLSAPLRPPMVTAMVAGLLLALAACGLARADGQIYKCVYPNGSKEITDINKGSMCKPMDLPGALIPAPPRHQAGAPSRGQAGAAPVATPADFPRVDGGEQRARDADRRAILDEELRNEQRKLAALRQEFNNGEPERRGDERNYAKYQERVAALRDSVARSEKNIDALKREIANIK